MKGVCQRCGLVRPLAALRKEWTGFTVCLDCYEKRHPQDFVRGVRDQQAVYGAKPPPTPSFAISYLLREDGSIYQRETAYVIVRE